VFLNRLSSSSLTSAPLLPTPLLASKIATLPALMILVRVRSTPSNHPSPGTPSASSRAYVARTRYPSASSVDPRVVYSVCVVACVCVVCVERLDDVRRSRDFSVAGVKRSALGFEWVESAGEGEAVLGCIAMCGLGVRFGHTVARFELVVIAPGPIPVESARCWSEDRGAG